MSSARDVAETLKAIGAEMSALTRAITIRRRASCTVQALLDRGLSLAETIDVRPLPEGARAAYLHGDLDDALLIAGDVRSAAAHTLRSRFSA